jgi:hypothetical protein
LTACWLEEPHWNLNSQKWWKWVTSLNDLKNITSLHSIVWTVKSQTFWTCDHYLNSFFLFPEVECAFLKSFKSRSVMDLRSLALKRMQRRS